MPKKKTNKSAKKRVRITKTGKVMKMSPGKRHLNSGQSRKSLRNLGKKSACAPGDAKKVIRLLGATRP